MTPQDWLGADNQLGMDIWTNKYCNNGESFDHWLDRVSGQDEAVKELIDMINEAWYTMIDL